MKSFWRLLMIVMLAIALPARVYAIPVGPCCTEEPAAQTAALHDVAPAIAGHSGESDSDSKGSPSGMPHVCCNVMCATAGIVAIAVGSKGSAGPGVRNVHRESAFTSSVPERLERPPQMHHV